MISNLWIEKRNVYWDRMAALIGKTGAGGVASLSREELREMAMLYRQIASDLSAVRQDGTARTLESKLNLLLARAHNIVYSGRKTSLDSVLRFLRDDYPLLFRRLLPFTLVSLAVFLGSGLLGVLISLVRPEFMHTLLGPAMVQTIQRHEMWTHSVSSMAPQASSAILTNNLSVIFGVFAAGITAGVGTLYLIALNGMLIGVIGTACHLGKMSVLLWSFVAPHGSLELPSILISGGAGLRLAYGFLFPGMYSRRYSIALAGAESGRLIAGLIPLLVIAGILEGFFSPSAAPIALKFLVGAVLFSMLVLWLSSSFFWTAKSGAAPRSTNGAANPAI